MTAKQAAAYLQIGLDRLGEFEKHHELPTHRLGTGPKAQRRYFKDELDAWLKFRWTAKTADRQASRGNGNGAKAAP